MLRTRSLPTLPSNLKEGEIDDKPVVDTRKTAERRRDCMDKAFCLFNFNCLGRCYGRSILQSGTVRLDHPVHNDDIAKKYLPMFNTMSLSIRSIETLFEVFQLIDADGSGEIDIDEFLVYFRLQKSRFAKRAFDVIDADGSGEIDFGEFVLGLYNFCTFDNLSLCRFAFEIYDEDSSGNLDHEEIEQIVKDLYGRRGFKRNKSAQKCVEQLKAMEWYSGSGNELTAGDSTIDFKSFHLFSKNHPTLLYPAFMMQYDLQSKVLGSGFWQCAAEQRKELERISNCGNDLIGALQQMHANEEEFAVQHNSNSLNFTDSNDDADNLVIDPFDSTVAKDNISNISPPSSPTNRNNRNSINKSKSKKTASLRSKYMVGGKNNIKKSNPYSAKKGDISPDKQKKKEELKGKYKRELRATRKAISKGKDPEKAKKKATAKFEKEVSDSARRKERKRPNRVRKDVGLAQQDGSMAWKCSHCQHANYAASTCSTCSKDRGIFDAEQVIPLSPKRKMRRNKTFG